MYASDHSQLHCGPIELRILTPGCDLDAYTQWLHDPQIVRHLEVRFDLPDLPTLRNYVQAVWDSRTDWLWGIFLTGGGSHIGNIKLGSYNSHHQSADIGLLIGDRSQWGKGYASTAIQAVTNFAFTHTSIAKLTAGMYATNEGSHRAFLRAGFSDEGRRLSQYVDNTSRVDGLLVGMTRAQWLHRP